MVVTGGGLWAIYPELMPWRAATMHRLIEEGLLPVLLLFLAAFSNGYLLVLYMRCLFNVLDEEKR